MKLENRALLAMALAVALVAGGGGAYFLTSRAPAPGREILAETRFQLAGYDSLSVDFSVPVNGTLVGAWMADTTVCERVQLIRYPLVSAPLVCSTSHTFDDPLVAGLYVLYFTTLGATQQPPSPNGSAMVTIVQTIQVV